MPHQLDALLRCIDSEERFTFIAAPTGFGKELLAWSLINVLGARGLILTARHVLADAYASDFRGQIADIRGQQNYPCLALNSGGALHRYRSSRDGMCDRGPCHHGVRCSLMFDGCTYYDAQRAATEWDGAVSSNYSYWIAHGKQIMSGRVQEQDEVLGQFGVLVCDEAHSIVQELRSALKVEVSRRELEQWTGTSAPLQGEVGDWSRYAQRVVPVIEEQITELRREVSMIGLMTMTGQALTRLRALREAMDLVSGADQDWCVTEHGDGVELEVVHPRKYAERLLYRGIERVVLMSATLTRKDIGELIA
jgi:hypothetical protein